MSDPSLLTPCGLAALHEAAHAGGFYCGKVAVHRVEITQDGGGKTCHMHLDDWVLAAFLASDKAMARNAVLSQMVGALAPGAADGRELNDIDWDAAVELAERWQAATGENAALMVERGVWQARRWVLLHHEQVESFAMQLLWGGRAFSGDTLQRRLAKTFGPRPPSPQRRGKSASAASSASFQYEPPRRRKVVDMLGEWWLDPHYRPASRYERS